MTTTTAENNIAVFRRFIEEGPNRGHMEVLDEIVAPDCTYYVPVAEDPLRGAEAVKQLVAGFRAAFPDLHVTIEDVLAGGDIVAARVTASGTHRGELLGHEPTGRTASWPVVHWARFADGLLVEDRASFNVLSLLDQLGLAATPVERAAGPGASTASART